ncbi:uncharacterized protein AtWU_00946 [Aspergillus tubingensis]|uniref:uncharacterized protein n=1 Tax=Aspergillus tubingensis TaxID=5068 RepID=UPI0015778BA5|nr:uncharacterized protein AtWU_00946 [Aspergillus tubingensis]GFN11150.1 hypothetical protein AtWU_00946 [Aspergillus tubingensis]
MSTSSVQLNNQQLTDAGCRCSSTHISDLRLPDAGCLSPQDFPDLLLQPFAFANPLDYSPTTLTGLTFLTRARRNRAPTPS